MSHRFPRAPFSVSLGKRALVVVTLAIAACVARGDTPLPPPSRVTATSPSGRIRAISEPNAGTRIEDVKLHKVLWSLPDWHRSLFVSDDGKHLVTQYDGLNLIPTAFSDDLVLFTFWREGRKVRDIKVRDFVPDRHILQRTASHYYWGTVHGIDAQGRLKVERADGKIFFFDVNTGDTTKTQPSAGANSQPRVFTFSDGEAGSVGAASLWVARAQLFLVRRDQEEEA